MASKLIEAAALRSKVHKMVERSEHDHVVTEWDKGYRYGLARVESLIDKMPEAQICGSLTIETRRNPGNE